MNIFEAKEIIQSKTFEAKKIKRWRCLDGMKAFKFNKLTHFNNCWCETVLFEVEDVWRESKFSSLKSFRVLKIVDTIQFSSIWRLNKLKVSDEKILHFKYCWCEKVFKSGRGLKLKKLFIVEHGRSAEVN